MSTKSKQNGMAHMCFGLSCICVAKKIVCQTMFRVLLFYSLFENVYLILQAADGYTHAFINIDGELQNLLNGMSIDMQKFTQNEDTSSVSFSDIDEENLNAYASPIAFSPPNLNFHFHPVGMPFMQRVFVQNLSPDTSIHMLSISGNTLHTHCSFFKNKIIPPGRNTSFDVVLLVREEGVVEDILFIHTSLGSFKFQVSAIGTLNPYRLRPLIGVKMPLNSSYSPLIYMHNPYSSTLQVTEIYTSGGDLHLELPESENEPQKNLWEIFPYETKPVIKANFIARIEKNHTAYIRIRTNSSLQEYLVLPVEVYVSSDTGLYFPFEVLDFGILRSHDEPKVLTLSLLNAGQKHVHIVNVIATPVNEAIDVKFLPKKVMPDTVFTTQVATITFNPSRALHAKQCCGKIVIKSKHNQYKLHIPYHSHLIRGWLDYDKNSTKFLIGLQNPYQRALNITNKFDVSFIVYNISLAEEAKQHFTIKMNYPVVLNSGQSVTVAFITFRPTITNLQLTSYIRLHTNISYLDIPLLCFTGQLKVFLPLEVNESLIDFGTLEMGDKRTVIFAVINENPVDVNLKFWGSNSNKTYIDLVGVDKGNASTLLWRQNFSAIAHSLVLKPHHYAIFRIGITAPIYEGLFHGEAFVETQYEKIKVPYNLRTAKGSLRIDKLCFENSFPGKISTQSLFIHSTFSHSMKITGINAIPRDSGFMFDMKQKSLELHPNTRSMVAKIYFDYRKYCKDTCYCGLPTTTEMGHQWLMGMALPSDVSGTDTDLFTILDRRWNVLKVAQEIKSNHTLRLDTTEVRGYLFKAHTSLQWPRLVNKYKLKFPITQIGNHSVKDFTIENPSSLPLLVQILPISLYPNPTSVQLALKNKYGDEYNVSHIVKDSGLFSLQDLEDHNHIAGNHIPTYRKSLEEFFGVSSHEKTIAMLLTPGMRVRVQVRFTPNNDAFKSSVILIRNNLTVIDAVLVHGQGGGGEIKFGAISSGSESPLTFDLTQNLLKDCDSSKSLKYTSPNFTVRRSFTARNTGVLPIYVKSLDFSGRICQGYGFKILNCQSFELKPNATRKIDIAYTPDFSLTHIKRTLNIVTSQSANGEVLHFNVAATIPKHLLYLCVQAIPRPYWEYFVYIFFLSVSVFLILSVVTCAYIDSQRILHTTFFPLITIGVHSEECEKENIFDLNFICSSALDTNSYINKSYESEENIKTEENAFKFLSASQKNLLDYCEITVRSPAKSKESVKELDDKIVNTYKNSKKKISKPKQIYDHSFESDLIEIKKSQPRNSWTRFLKPPFSFHHCSNMNNKPSVATQTLLENADNDTPKSLKHLDMIGEQNVNCFLNLANNTRTKSVHKDEIKFIKPEPCIKKLNDNFPEEETSSTTTETSTTESDISEKDNRLPDVCTISKPPKNKHSKHKSQNRKSEVTNQVTNYKQKNENCRLDANSKGLIKKRANPDVKFNSKVQRPAGLELPYNPARGIENFKIQNLESPQSAELYQTSLDLVDDTYSDFVERTDKFSKQQEFYNCQCFKSFLENRYKPITDLQFTEYPTSYSDVLNHEISNCSGVDERSVFSISRCCRHSVKSQCTNQLKNPHPHSSYSKLYSNSSQSYGTNIWNGNPMYRNSQEANKKLSGSKLYNWILQPNCSNYLDNQRQHYMTDSTALEQCNHIQDSYENISNAHEFYESTCQSENHGLYCNWPGINLPLTEESLWDRNYNPSLGTWFDNKHEASLDSFKTLCQTSSIIWNNNLSSIWKSDDLSTSSSASSIYSEVSTIGTKSAKQSNVSEAATSELSQSPSAFWNPEIKNEKNVSLTVSPPWSFSLFSDASNILLSNTINDKKNDEKHSKS